MKQFSLKLITATVAVIIAVLSYGLMSFVTQEKVQPAQELQWYFHIGNNSYADLGLSEDPPTSCTPPTDNPEICLKGFKPENDPGLSGVATATGDQEIERQKVNL